MRTVSPFLCAALLALAAGCASSSNASTPAAPPAAASSGGDTATAPSATMETAPTTAPSQLSATAEAAATTATTATSEPAASTAATTATAPATPAAPATTTATTTATAPAATTATTAPAPTPPAAGGAQLVARGRAVHNRVCATCHEPGEHEGPNPGLNWAEDRMRRQIRQGGGRMRAIAATRLNDADLDALIAFYRSNRTVRGS
jgi:mono/diheme cytochrome c family protein